MKESRLAHLFRQYGVAMICFWTLVILLLAILTVNNHHSNIIRDAANEARDYFRLNMFYRTWAARMGGVYVSTGKVKPNPHLHVPNRDVRTVDNQELTLVNPAYMTRMVFESIAASSPDPVINKITSLKPRKPRNTPDEWEKKRLEVFDRRECNERAELATINGKPYLRLITSFITDATCLKCHAQQGYKIGDVRGAITISVPLSNRYVLQKDTDKNIIGGYAMLWLLGCIGISVSSLRRSASEDALSANERKFRTVCDWTQDWEYWVAPDGVMKYVSPSCYEITGYSQDEFMRDPMLLEKIIHPDQKHAFSGHFKHLPSVNATEADLLEFEIVTKTGDIRWMQHLCRPIFEDSVYLGRRASNRDITNQKLSDEKVSRLSAIVEHSNDAIISKTLDGLVTSWNRGAEKLFGYSEREMLGTPMHRLFPEDRIDEEQKILDTVASGGSVENFETVRIRKEGKKIDVSVTISPIKDTAGNIIGVSKIARDISELIKVQSDRLEFERHLMQTQKLESLGVLAGGIAHDFNNILMAIVGHADLALMRVNKESPAIENLRQVLEAAARASDLARQMLAYSGKGQFVIQNLNLNLLIEEMMHMLEVSISKKGVLRLNLEQSIPAVSADATQLRQVVMNLVINASEAIGDKSGVIAITTGCINCDQKYLQQVKLSEPLPEGLYVSLEVADTGCGMDQETMSRIFDPFFTTKFTGRGLGMAAVQGIIRGHKGAIKVYSEVGKGTTFKILLPATSLPHELFDGGAQPEDTWQGSGKVLLVDDEESVLGIGSEMLRELGFTPITANDGKEALQIFRAVPDIAFVILDLTMPRMDGEQCFRELRLIKPDVKVLLSSGFSEQEATQRFTGKGLMGFIQKPYRFSALKSAVQLIS